MEWVEIIEPRTKEHMYANLTTGECVWDPPAGVHVKKTDNNQWWELFDQNTSRFYYYNATSQKTMWHRPMNCDIIPLAKLQTLKQNTEPPNSNASGTDAKSPQSRRKESVSTQTTSVGRCSIYNPDNATALSGGDDKPRGSAAIDTKQFMQSPSSSSRRSHHHHHHHHHHHQYSHRNSHRHHDSWAYESTSPSLSKRHHSHSQDSGRSSDSSVSHSRTSLESGATYRVLESPHRHDQCPHVLLPISTSVNPGSNLSPEGSTCTIEARSYKIEPMECIKKQNAVFVSAASLQPSSSLSTSTPLLKKKTCSEYPSLRNVMIGNGESDKSANGRGSSSRVSYGLKPRNSSHPEVSVDALTGEISPYHSPQSVPVCTSKSPSQSDKYASLMDTCNRYHRERHSYHKDRVNSLEKSNVTGYYSGSVQSRITNTTAAQGNIYGSNFVSLGKRHLGCAGSLSGVNLTEPDGTLSTEKNKALITGNEHRNVIQPKGVEESHWCKGEQQEEYAPAKSINLMENGQQGLVRSYSFAEQQRRQHIKKRDGDDDSMHERYLLGQVYPQRQRLGSNTSSSNESGSSAICSELGLHVSEDVNDRRKGSNGNPSPPDSPYYGNVLVDADHLLPLQHYILQQAKLSGCYKFGDPILTEEADDLLDDDRRRDADDNVDSRTILTGGEDDSDDQFADDEAASNQDSSSQEYLEDHYADLGNYDTAGLATYYNTAETLNRSQAGSSEPATLPSTAPLTTSSSPPETSTISCAVPQIRELSSVGSTRSISLLTSNVFPSLIRSYDIADSNDHTREGSNSGGGDIEKYAQDNLNLNCGRPKGLRLLFRKKFSIRDILSWTKDPIPRPMLNVVEGEKLLKREACNLFRLVQVYMGDRKASLGMTLDGVAMEIVNTVFSKPALRDELYVQICRQTTENPRKESLRRGWELMAVCLAFVPPSATFERYLEGYMNRHRDPNFQFSEVAKWPIHVQVSHYATVACRRLQRIGAHGKRPPRKATIEDIDQARLQIFRASMFGATLSEVMALQRDRFSRDLPWVQTTLTRQVLVRGGTLTEGIFRVSADADEVSALKSCLDKFEDGGSLTASQDAHAPASLLKLWVRELYEPLIPDSFYTECVSMKHDDHEASAAIAAAIIDRLPALNRRVLCHLIRFFQIFARAEVVVRTKMDANNLAMVMAPNILRCTSQDPRVILENARKEMAFVRILIESLDTAWIDDLN